jgi:uncharacterized protein (TIGR00255 family)
MTGQGQALVSQAGCTVQAEIRSVNNRFLKVAVRCGERFNELAPRVERLVQAQVRRGTVNVSLKVSAAGLNNSYRINPEVLHSYQQQVASVCGGTLDWGQQPQLLAALLGLPGVADDGGGDAESLEVVWPIVELAVSESIERLNEMRAVEGQAMARDLSENLEQIAARVREIEHRAPLASQSYQQRILERIQQLLATARSGDAGLAAASSESGGPSIDLIREVAVFADRCDFSEETVRLRSHLTQFSQLLQDRDSQGRKMDFLIQELVRETNTIGSKANDAGIAGQVVEIKTCIERLREMVQNIE